VVLADVMIHDILPFVSLDCVILFDVSPSSRWKPSMLFDSVIYSLRMYS
jgi:hypothetical protein